MSKITNDRRRRLKLNTVWPRMLVAV